MANNSTCNYKVACYSPHSSERLCAFSNPYIGYQLTCDANKQTRAILYISNVKLVSVRGEDRPAIRMKAQSA